MPLTPDLSEHLCWLEWCSWSIKYCPDIEAQVPDLVDAHVLHAHSVIDLMLEISWLSWKIDLWVPTRPKWLGALITRHRHLLELARRKSGE